MKYTRLYQALIPENLQRDVRQFGYAKNLVAACVISFFASFFYAGIYFYLHHYSAFYVILCGEFFYISSLFILKYSRSLIITSMYLLTFFATVLVWLTYSMGGIESPSAYWLVLLPFIAFYIGGMLSGAIWCVITFFIISLMYILQNANIIFPTSPIIEPLFLQYISICGLMMIIITLVYFYELVNQHNLMKLRYLASHDPLTNLPNRTGYDEILFTTATNASMAHTTFAVCYLDLDNFKSINDTYGHQVGDLLLKETANRIHKSLRKEDTVVRLSGDEFNLIIHNPKNPAALTKLVKAALVTIEKPFLLNKHEIYITASIGIAMFPYDTSDIFFLTRYADLALYKAKQLGGNTLQFFSDHLAKEEKYNIAIGRYLSDAIKNKELYLCYQPQFDNKNPNRIIGLETLLRWENKNLGDVSPDRFIKVAEQMGIVSYFGEWVLREACQQYTQWLAKGLVTPEIYLSVNVSVYQLNRSNFISYLEAVIEDTGIAPACLELELTETAILSNRQHAILILEKLNEMGIRVTIDDFGTGYTSLNYLNSLPVSGIKIDKSYLDDMLTKDASVKIIKALISLAHDLNLTVVAEGIENIEQLKLLKEMNCDYVQGYYLSKPLKVPAIEALLTLIHSR